MKGNIHTSVLLHEAIDGLAIQAGNRYIDATLGAAGHAIEILQRGGILLGIDTDNQILPYARNAIATTFPEKKEGIDWVIAQGNFNNVVQIARQNGFEKIAGIIFDLGVSSMQLDTPERGFSYRFDESKLDLRLNQTSGQTAYEAINELDEESLYDIFSHYGEEQLSRSIARAVLIARRVKPIMTTGDLKLLIQSVTHDTKVSASILSRIFQALRIYVNDELTSLKTGLSQGQQLLIPSGRMSVISFHSLEDRIVKQFFATPQWNVITKRPITPSKEELYANNRARSAKLRIGELL